MLQNKRLRQAYNFIRGRRLAYQSVFPRPSVPVEIVLEDLARFCRANASTAHKDPYIAARLDGRREVFLRIQQHLHLTDDEIWRLATGGASVPTPDPTGDDE